MFNKVFFLKIVPLVR